MHNYPPASAFKLKMENWVTLNRKVFKKLDINLSDHVLEKLAKAEGTVIHVLLHHILMKTKEHKDCENRLQMSQNASDDVGNDVMTVNITKRVGSSYEIVPQRMILYSLYDNLEQKLEEKDQVIVTLMQKNQHLENLLNLKNLRIEDLQKRLGRISAMPSKESVTLDE